jgi:hypothetical protein
MIKLENFQEIPKKFTTYSQIPLIPRKFYPIFNYFRYMGK